MTNEQKILRDTINQKLESNEQLTDEEEFFYLTVMIGKTEDEANNIIAIAENTDTNTLID